MICYQLWTSRSPFQSRCRDMLTVNVKKSRKETMHISWKNAWNCRIQHWHLKFMLFLTLKRGGRGSPDRLAGVWYRCTGSFCFDPSGPSQYMTLNSTWLLFDIVVFNIGIWNLCCFQHWNGGGRGSPDRLAGGSYKCKIRANWIDDVE